MNNTIHEFSLDKNSIRGAVSEETKMRFSSLLSSGLTIQDHLPRSSLLLTDHSTPSNHTDPRYLNKKAEMHVLSNDLNFLKKGGSNSENLQNCKDTKQAYQHSANPSPLKPPIISPMLTIEERINLNYFASILNKKEESFLINESQSIEKNIADQHSSNKKESEVKGVDDIESKQKKQSKSVVIEEKIVKQQKIDVQKYKSKKKQKTPIVIDLDDPNQDITSSMNELNTMKFFSSKPLTQKTTLPSTFHTNHIESTRIFPLGQAAPQPNHEAIDKEMLEKQSKALHSSFKKLTDIKPKVQSNPHQTIEISDSEEQNKQKPILKSKHIDSDDKQTVRKKALAEDIQQPQLQSNIKKTEENQNEDQRGQNNSRLLASFGGNEVKKKLLILQPFKQKKLMKQNFSPPQASKRTDQVTNAPSHSEKPSVTFQQSKSFPARPNPQAKTSHNPHMRPTQPNPPSKQSRPERQQSPIYKLYQFDEIKQTNFYIGIQLLSDKDINLAKMAKQQSKFTGEMKTGPRHASKNTTEALKIQSVLANSYTPHPKPNIIQCLQIENPPLSLPKKHNTPRCSPQLKIEQSLYQMFIQRRIIKQGQIIDLGVLSLDEVIEHCFNNKIISEELYTEFVSFSTSDKIVEFVKIFTENRLKSWNFKELKFTILDHRRLAEWLVLLFPKKYQIGPPLALNHDIYIFLSTLYDLTPKEYVMMTNVVDQHSKVSLWGILKIRYRKTNIPSDQPSRKQIKQPPPLKRQYNPSNMQNHPQLTPNSIGSIPHKKRII